MRSRPRFVVALMALAIAPMILTTSVSAGPAVKGQRIMLEQKHRFGTPNGTFVFYSLSPGPLELDSGRYVYAAAEQPNVVRKGQRAAVYKAVESLTGRRGTFVVRWRAEFVGAGAGSTVGTGTWSLVRGTGAYAGATGGGRLAAVIMTPRGFTTSLLEGLLRVPPS